MGFHPHHITPSPTAPKNKEKKKEKKNRKENNQRKHTPQQKHLKIQIIAKLYLWKSRNWLLLIHFVFILLPALLLNFTWLFFPVHLCQRWEISNLTYWIRPYLKMKRKHICSEIH